MQPKGGVTLIIAVGGGKPPSHGHSNSKKEGLEMIKVPMDALVSEDETGEIISPEVGDTVGLSEVGGEITSINEDGTVHIEVKTANGAPVEYVTDIPVEEEVIDDADLLDAEAIDAEEAALDAEGDELLAAAEAADEEALF
jgi:hypothetical protein